MVMSLMGAGARPNLRFDWTRRGVDEERKAMAYHPVLRLETQLRYEEPKQGFAHRRKSRKRDNECCGAFRPP